MKINTIGLIPAMFWLLLSVSCSSPEEKNIMKNQLEAELHKIDTLLRDKNFALEMAETLEAAYHKGIGEPAPVFLNPGDDTATITKLQEAEKTATSIAPFYALECGIGVLCEQQGGTFYGWLDKLLNNKADSATWLLLNRFANATWKAGQPFRDLSRIERPVFMVANLLSQEEVDKDRDQLTAAAVKLEKAMKDVKDSSAAAQFVKLKTILQDETFAYEAARHADSSYAVSQKMPVPPYTVPGHDTSTVKKTVKQEKIATNVAGFYALECGMDYLVTLQQKAPSQILHAVIRDSLDAKDKTLLLRFANATWKAGQPFRGLERIKRPNFIPASMLSEQELEKDWVQVKAAAKKLLEKLEVNH